MKPMREFISSFSFILALGLAAMQMAHKKLAQRFPLSGIPLKRCAGGGAAAGVAARPAGGPSAPAQIAQRQDTVRSAPKNPPVCPGVQFCEEVNDFAVTITDFRASLNGPTKVLTATMRFRSKSDRPVTLGYIPGSGVGTDERGIGTLPTTGISAASA